ncbi:oligosaccharide flippase family protein [Flavobacterium luteum]|uniref:Oligosaccharide flippase family protein n=1 Tax=Flavobacterium luteum TaxID=2026654 RepID=A0A7J5AI27_9FLAO|nr:oligosaccharide flippase family protein [Flavobacterium luteum]KAB1157058.1 oligosaccharide flippase family protein [Flavobacterium luteum]
MFKARLKITSLLVSNIEHINSSLFLFFINSFNFVFPLLLSPIIIQRCGLEGFGLVILFQSIVVLISSITDYGFNINATREITINKSDLIFINRHFFIINYTKVFLLAIAIFLCGFIYFVFPKASDYSFLYWTSITILLGRAFNPMWVLRALHKMHYVFYFYVFFKIATILVLYLFLQDKGNLFLVNLTIGLSDFFTYLFACLILIYKMNWRHYLPNYKAIVKEISEGFGIFIQVLSINANSYLNPMILGYFVDEYSLGIYCVVEKIILAVKFCGSFVIQSVFPKSCEIAIESSTNYRAFAQKLFIFLVISMFTAAVILNVFSDIIVSYFVKSNIEQCQKLLIYNSWIPFIVALNMVPYLTFLVYGKHKSVTPIIILAVFINVFINVILSKSYGIYGISTGIYITELFISISLWAILIFKYPKYNFLRQ